MAFLGKVRWRTRALIALLPDCSGYGLGLLEFLLLHQHVCKGVFKVQNLCVFGFRGVSIGHSLMIELLRLAIILGFLVAMEQFYSQRFNYVLVRILKFFQFPLAFFMLCVRLAAAIPPTLGGVLLFAAIKSC